MIKNCYVLIVLLYLFSALAIGQVVTPRSTFNFNIDISRFRYSNDLGSLDIYFVVFPYNITLERQRDTLRGSVLFQIEIKKADIDTTFIQSSLSLPIILHDTTDASLKVGYIGKTKYALPFGSYELKVIGSDVQNPARQDSIRRKFYIYEYNDTSMISDIDLCSRIVETQDKSNPFYKNSYEVLPNPSLVFEATIRPVVFTYAELYNLRSDIIYSVAAQITDAQRNILKQRVRINHYTIKNAVDVAMLNISSIPSGKYKFQLVLSDTLGNVFSKSEKPIFIYNPNIQQSTASATDAKSVEFMGMSSDELMEEFRKSRYIVSDVDRKTFDKLTTADAQRMFLAKFWSEIEEGKRGIREMTRALYHQRVITANQRYRSMGREGWLADRGRIYILLGEPDEIQRFPSSENSKPYEIWNYYQIENGVIFVFVDRTGFGEYILVHSTKRGELQDESWERFLH